MEETFTFDPNAFDDVEHTFQPPEGKYIVAFTAGDLAVSKMKKTPYFNAKCTVLDGEHTGKFIFAKVWLTPKTAGIIASYCHAMGVEKSFDTTNLEEVREAFLNRPFKASLKIRTNGEYSSLEVAFPVSRKRLSAADLERIAMLEAQKTDGGFNLAELRAEQTSVVDNVVPF